MMDHPRFLALYFARELRRIGVDLHRFNGLATANGPPPAEFLRMLRTIPGGLGHDAFLALVDGWASDWSNAPGPGVPEAPDVADFTDSHLDDLLAYWLEFERVVPPSTIEGLTVDVASERYFRHDDVEGRTRALRILRGLADGAGLEAYHVAFGNEKPR